VVSCWGRKTLSIAALPGDSDAHVYLTSLDGTINLKSGRVFAKASLQASDTGKKAGSLGRSGAE